MSVRAPARRAVRRVERDPERERRLRPAGRREGRLWRAALAVVAAAAALRLVLAAVAPLVPDEAYYWEWSRRLASGYFDHPPMIALLIAAGTTLFGATPFGVRVVPVLAGALTMLLVVDLARRHGGARAALAAAMVASCVPLAAAGLVLAAPDTPLLLAYALCLWALDRALLAEPGTPPSYGWWILAGAALGFGLAAKYTAVLVPLGVLAACVLRPSLRHWLRTPEPYLASLLALLAFAPVVVWNLRHDWASFAFQLRNGLAPSTGSGLGRVAELLGNQVVLVSPILFVLLGLATAAALRRPRDDRRFVLAMIAATTFLFFVYTALRQRPEPNWPAPAYLPAFVLLATLAVRGAWRRWARAGSLLGAAMIALIYVQVLQPVLPIPARKDPMARGHGWVDLAGAVHRAAPAGGPGVWYAANRYQDAAGLAFHLPGRPDVFSLNLGSRPNQYDYWPGFADRARPGDALVLALDDGPAHAEIARRLAPLFATVRTAGTVELKRGDDVFGTRRIWVFEGWGGGWLD